jgi:DNA polymerase III subunit delta'
LNDIDIYPWSLAQWMALPQPPAALPSTLLLAGPIGVGKRRFARSLAQGLLCANPGPQRQACASCSSCRLFVSASHPDFRLIEPASANEANETASEGTESGPSGKRLSRSILIEQVRDLDDFIRVTSHLGGYKVVVIQPAERLNANAANALLKTLEEPGAATKFILVSDRAQQLPATVRSRCFRVDFPIPQTDAALEWLKANNAKEPEITLAQAGFAPLAALELSQGESWERRRVLSERLAAPDATAADLAGTVGAEDLPLLCSVLYRWCYDALSLRLGGRLRYNPDYAKSLRRIADNAEVLRLQDLMRDLVTASRALEHPLNTRLAIEQLAIRYTRTIARREP